jgi:hypothetical protein
MSSADFEFPRQAAGTRAPRKVVRKLASAAARLCDAMVAGKTEA